MYAGFFLNSYSFILFSPVWIRHSRCSLRLLLLLLLLCDKTYCIPNCLCILYLECACSECEMGFCVFRHYFPASLSRIRFFVSNHTERDSVSFFVTKNPEKTSPINRFYQYFCFWWWISMSFDSSVKCHTSHFDPVTIFGEYFCFVSSYLIVLWIFSFKFQRRKKSKKISKENKERIFPVKKKKYWLKEWLIDL